MKDAPDKVLTRTPKPPVVLMGSKDSLDAAQVWARAICHSVLGPVEGERHYRQMPALPILLAYKAMLLAGDWH